MEKVLITGGTGFLGSYLTKRFLLEGYTVGIIKRSTSNTIRIDSVLHQIEAFDVDSHSPSAIVNNFEPQYIIHTACDYGRGDSTLKCLIETNVLFGVELLEAAIDTKVSTFVNTDSLLPEDVNEYSLSKYQFKNWLKLKSECIDVINLRLEHMYGPGDDSNKFVYWLIGQLRNPEISNIPLTSGIQKRDFIYIDDVIDAFLLTLRSKSHGFNSYDVGTGNFVEVKEFVKEIAKLITTEENPIIYDKLGFGEVKYRANEIMEPKLNNNKLKDLGWVPKFNYKMGLKKLLENS